MVITGHKSNCNLWNTVDWAGYWYQLLADSPKIRAYTKTTAFVPINVCFQCYWTSESWTGYRLEAPVTFCEWLHMASGHTMPRGKLHSSVCPDALYGRAQTTGWTFEPKQGNMKFLLCIIIYSLQLLPLSRTDHELHSHHLSVHHAVRVSVALKFQTFASEKMHRSGTLSKRSDTQMTDLANKIK